MAANLSVMTNIHGKIGAFENEGTGNINTSQQRANGSGGKRECGLVGPRGHAERGQRRRSETMGYES